MRAFFASFGRLGQHHPSSSAQSANASTVNSSVPAHPECAQTRAMTLTLIRVSLPLACKFVDDSSQALVNLIDKRADSLPGSKIKVLFNVRPGIEDDFLNSCGIYVDLNHSRLPVKTRGDEDSKV